MLRHSMYTYKTNRMASSSCLSSCSRWSSWSWSMMSYLTMSCSMSSRSLAA